MPNLTLRFIVLPALALMLTIPAMAQRTLSVLSSDGTLRMAQDLLDRKNYQGAQAAFDQFLRQHPENEPATLAARYYSAHCGLQLGQPDAPDKLLAIQNRQPGHVYESRINYDLGDHAFRQRNWEAAVRYLTRIPSDGLEEPLQTESEYKTGVACFQLQQYDRARACFQKTSRPGSPVQGQSAYYTAYLNYRDGLYDEALSDLNRAGQSPEFRPAIPLLKASILYRKKAYDEVVEFAEATFRDTARITGTEDLHLLAGEAWFQKKEYTKAAVHFDAYSKTIKGSFPRGLQFRMAFAQFRNDQTDKAIAGFRQVAARLDTLKGRQDSLGQFACYYLGVCYLRKDQKQFAFNAYDQASLMNADARIREVSWFTAGKLSYDLEKYAEAVEILQDFVASNPSSSYVPEANELIGEGLLNASDFDAALAYMEKTRVKSDRLSLAYQRAAYQRGVTFFNDGNAIRAAELFQQSLRYPQDKETEAAARYWLAESYSKERQFAKAQPEYSALLRMDASATGPYATKARYGLAYATFNLKEYSKALGQFREAITEIEKTPGKPNLSDALLRYADCFYATKDYPSALRQYDKAMDARTAEMDYAFYQKGMVYAGMNDYDNARTNFSVVVEKYNRSRYYDQALFQKAQMDFLSRQYEAAIKGYSQILQTMEGSPVLPWCYLNRGIAASNLKEYPAAIRDFKKFLDDFPSHPAADGAIGGLQEALAQTGEVEQLAGYIERYKKANPESDALESIEFETCKALYNNQKYDKAITGFTEYLKNYSESSFVPEARFYLAESHYRGGSKPEALRMYREILAAGRNNWYIRASFRAAELEYAGGNFAASATLYQNLLGGVVKSGKDINNASLGLLESLYQLGKYDTVGVMAADLLKKENLAQDVANRASLYAAKVFVGKGEYEKAIDELLNTVNNAQDINGAEAQYLVGEVLYRQKKYNESLAALFELKSRFSAYPKWYNRGFLLMADNYMAQKEYFQAQATLNSIVEYARDKETVAAAKAKLAELKKEAGDELKP